MQISLFLFFLKWFLFYMFLLHFQREPPITLLLAITPEELQPEGP